MKKIYFLFIAMCITIFANAQFPNFQWAFNATNYDIHTTAEDNSGNVYIAGIFTGTQDFDPGPGSANVTAIGAWGYVAKYNSAGNFLAVKTITNNSSSCSMNISKIKIDNSDNIYLIGSLNDPNYNFSLSAGTVTIASGPSLPSSSSTAGFIIKYDSNWNYLWSNGIFNTSNPGIGIGPTDMVFDGGFVHVAGTTTDRSSSCVVSYAPFSTFVVPVGTASVGLYGWVIGYSASTGGGAGTPTLMPKDSRAPVLESDNLGNYYVSYWVNAAPKYTIIQKKVGSGVLWSRQIFSVEVSGIGTDNNNDVYTYGNFIGTTDFDASASTYTLTSVANTRDPYVLKYDNAGNFAWCGTFGNNLNEITQRAINVVKQTGEIYITGEFNNTIDVDFGGGVNNLTDVTPLSFDTYLAKYDINSNFIWATSFSSIDIEDINSTPNNLYLTGRCSNNTDMDFSASSFSINSIPAGFISKYTNCTAAPIAPGSITGLTSICTGAATTTYSVASVSGATSYSWSLPGIGWSGTSTTNTINLTPGSVSGNLSVIATNACGSSSASVLSITVNPTPTISINSGSICLGSSFTMSPSGASTYTFSSGTAIVSPTVNASYSVTGTSSTGCVASNTAVASVTVNSLPIISVNSGSICSGSSFTMSPSGASTYTFSSGTAIVSPTANASYSVSGTSTAGCISSSSAVSNVTVFTNPTANAGSSQTITCSFPSVPLNGSGVSTYTWSGPGIVSGGNTSSPIVNMAGTYSLVGSTSGCNSNTATVNVLTNTIAPSVTASSNNSLICGPPFQGTATLTATGSVATYSWMPSGSGASISVSPSVTTTYTVIATGSNGCTNMATITQNVSTCTGINEFSDNSASMLFPNPTNGHLTLISKGKELEIFNSIGKLIYKRKIENERTEIDLEKESSGIYFIKVDSEIKKIIKE